METPFVDPPKAYITAMALSKALGGGCNMWSMSFKWYNGWWNNEWWNNGWWTNGWWTNGHTFFVMMSHVCIMTSIKENTWSTNSLQSSLFCIFKMIANVDSWSRCSACVCEHVCVCMCVCVCACVCACVTTCTHRDTHTHNMHTCKTQITLRLKQG